VDQLENEVRGGEIAPAVRAAVIKAVQMRRTMVDVERQIAAHTQQITEIAAEQNRIRENMKTVAPASQYYERLLAKLNEQESLIERLQKEREDLTAKRDELRRGLTEYLDSLTVG
jgi:DNA repair exonuclease SbcCD ATPase subunit